MRLRTLVITGSAFVLGLVTSAGAYLFMPSSVPDALKHAEAWVKGHPAAADGYFFLGRINGSAWAKGTAGDAAKVSIATFGDDKNPPRFVPWDSLMFERDPKLEMTPEAKTYLEASIAAYRKAATIEADNPLYQLGLGWGLEQAAKAHLEPTAESAGLAKLTVDEQGQCELALVLLSKPDFATRDQAAKSLVTFMPRDADMLAAVKSDDPEVNARIGTIVEEYWLGQAAEHYRKAYEKTVAADLKANRYDSEADTSVSVKAGERLLAILPALPANKPEELTQIEQALKVIKAKPGVGHDY